MTERRRCAGAALEARRIEPSDGVAARAAAGTMSVMAWLVQQVPISTATMAAIFGRGLQEVVWRDLAENGPATVHELSNRLSEDHQRVRNALYRLAMLQAVRCVSRVPSPLSASTPRVVWVALDRDGRPQAATATTPQGGTRSSLRLGGA